MKQKVTCVEEALNPILNMLSRNKPEERIVRTIRALYRFPAVEDAELPGYVHQLAISARRNGR